MEKKISSKVVWVGKTNIIQSNPHPQIENIFYVYDNRNLSKRS